MEDSIPIKIDVKEEKVEIEKDLEIKSVEKDNTKCKEDEKKHHG
jgi:hypothetical protein